MQHIPGRRFISTSHGTRRNCVLVALATLALSACAGDPAEYGITGPFPDGIAPVTLTRTLPRVEASDDTPGVRVDTADRLSPNARSGGSASPTRRYYGYDH